MPPDPALPEDGQAATQPGPVGDVHRDEHGHERILTPSGHRPKMPLPAPQRALTIT